jgi:predicted secreted protein
VPPAPLARESGTIRATVGGQFAIAKEMNGSIGYSWELADAGDSRIVALVGTVDSADAPRPPGPPIVGNSNTLTWTFRALAPGQTKIRFAFSQRTGLGMDVPGPEVYTVTVR